MLLADDPLIGTTLQDRYKIESIIGQGTMGVVYKAFQELIGRAVAVKVLHSHLVADKEALKRFHQQAKAASRLNHPHIITLYDYGVLGSGQPFIVMDLLKGAPLSKLLEERQFLPLLEAKPIIEQVCAALSKAHKHGVIHRDIKPENIVLELHDGPEPLVKVVDFGIAKIIQDGEDTLVRITATGLVCGSPSYMSPEQFRGLEVDQRSDIYSLAIVIFEILTGRLPFQASDLITLMSLHVYEPPPMLSQVRPDLALSAELNIAINHALSKELADRPATMDEFWQELEKGFADTTPGSAALVSNETKKGGEQISKASARQVLQTTAPEAGPVAEPVALRLPKTRTSVPWWVRAIGTMQRLLPTLVTITLIAVGYWIARKDIEEAVNYQVNLGLPQLTGAFSVSAEQLVLTGKLNEARTALLEKKAAGTISHHEIYLLNRVYLLQADIDAKKKDYKAAIKRLEQVSGSSIQVAKAKLLAKRYRHLLNRQAVQ